MKGRYVEAIEHLQKTLEIFETTYGKDSWLLVAKLSNLAQLYLDAVSRCVTCVRSSRLSAFVGNDAPIAAFDIRLRLSSLSSVEPFPL